MILTVLPLSIQFILVHNDNDDIAINFAMLDISKNIGSYNISFSKNLSKILQRLTF
jgi:hypothetical protein